MGSADEIVTIVDEHNNVVGAVTRAEVEVVGDHLALAASPRDDPLPPPKLLGAFDALLHGWVSRELFVQKRSASKDVFPAYYDPAAGGVVLAGETYEEGARRELEEELGIRDVDLAWQFDFYFASTDARVWGSAFTCVYDGPLVLQEEEIESGSFMTIGDILRRQATESFTPDGLHVLRRFLAL